MYNIFSVVQQIQNYWHSSWEQAKIIFKKVDNFRDNWRNFLLFRWWKSVSLIYKKFWFSYLKNTRLCSEIICSSVNLNTHFHHVLCESRIISSSDDRWNVIFCRTHQMLNVYQTRVSKFHSIVFAISSQANSWVP